MEKLGFDNKDYELYKDYFGTNFVHKKVVAKDNVYQKHDKTFKEILKKSNEMSEFLETFVKIKIKKENLKIYNNSFITKDYHRRESDIIYKRIDKNIFYIVEHQSKVDPNMPIRILEYCVELMRELKNTNTQKCNPLIIPIVLYTGDKKWNVSTEFSKTQERDNLFPEYSIKQIYKLIDINKYKIEELKQINNKISKMLMIEKCTNNMEIGKILEYLAQTANTKEDRIWINDLVTYVFAHTISEERIKEILKILYESEKDGEMDDLIERINRNQRIERRRIRAKSKAEGKLEGKLEGIKEALIKTIKNMQKYNVKDEDIMKYTNTTLEELETIKKMKI